MDISDIVSILTAVGALVVSLVAIGQLRVAIGRLHIDKAKGRVDSEKSSVDMSTGITLAAAELVDDLRQEVIRLRGDNFDWEKRDGEKKRKSCVFH